MANALVGFVVPKLNQAITKSYQQRQENENAQNVQNVQNTQSFLNG